MPACHRCHGLIVLLLGAPSPGAAQTRSALLLGQEFSGLSSQFLFAQIEGLPALMCSPGSRESRAEARVQLPADARVLGWEASLVDSSESFNLGLELVERCRSSADAASLQIRTLGTLGSTGQPGQTVLQQAVQTQPGVDPARCSYAVRADFRAGHPSTVLDCAGQGLQLLEVRVDYSSTAVLPAQGRVSLEGSALQREQFPNAWNTTELAQRHCTSTSQGAYFTTRVALPEGALPLALHAWIEDRDLLWNGAASLVEHCRAAAGTLHSRPLAQVETTGSTGAQVLTLPITDAAVQDLRSCALVVINSATVGDPCVSEQIRYGRMAVDYRIGGLFADGFELLSTAAGAVIPQVVTIDGQDLLGLSSGFRYSQDGLPQGMACSADATDSRAEARLELAPGLSLSGWRAWVSDSSATTDVRLELLERCRDLTQPDLLEQRVIGALQSTAASGAQLLQQVISPAVDVDPEHCTYALRADLAAGSGACAGAAVAVLQMAAALVPAQR